MLTFILSAGAAIVISAFCSVAEAVLYSVPLSHIQLLREAGRPSGEVLQSLRRDVEKPITAILTLNTIANTAGASVAGAAAAELFGSEILGIFAAVFTLSILVFSEVVPKTLGVAYCKQLAPVLANPLKYLTICFYPLSALAVRLRKLIAPGKAAPQSTEAELKAIATLTRQSGEIKAFEEAIIKNILDLEEKVVEDIMTPRTVVHSLPANCDALEASKHSLFFNYTRVPVHNPDDNEDITGIVYRRSVLISMAADRPGEKLSELMVPAEFVLENLTLDRLLQRFLDTRLHLFVVLDEYGGLAGVVSFEDVMEELLGREILDETDTIKDLRAYARRHGKERVRDEKILKT